MSGGPHAPAVARVDQAVEDRRLPVSPGQPSGARTTPTSSIRLRNWLRARGGPRIARSSSWRWRKGYLHGARGGDRKLFRAAENRDLWLRCRRRFASRRVLATCRITGRRASSPWIRQRHAAVDQSKLIISDASRRRRPSSPIKTSADRRHRPTSTIFVARPPLDMFLADGKFLLQGCSVISMTRSAVRSNCTTTILVSGWRPRLQRRQREGQASPPYYLRILDGQVWRHQIWSRPQLRHPAYDRYVSDENQQLPIYLGAT